MDWKLFGSTFALIFVSELPDKTAFASLLLATRNRPLPVFFGAWLKGSFRSLSIGTPGLKPLPSLGLRMHPVPPAVVPVRMLRGALRPQRRGSESGPHHLLDFSWGN